MLTLSVNEMETDVIIGEHIQIRYFILCCAIYRVASGGGDQKRSDAALRDRGLCSRTIGFASKQLFGQIGFIQTFRVLTKDQYFLWDET